MSDEPKTPEPWSEYRFDQLQALERLLTDCQRINSASDVTARLERLIRGAEELDRCDHQRRLISFTQFLKEHAIHGTWKLK